MLHPPTPDELTQYDWYAERDKAKEALYAFVKDYTRWGQVVRIPVNVRSSFLRCDICTYPREEALFVSWRTVLYCEKHMRKYWRDKRVNWAARALRERLEEQQRNFR